MYWQTSGGCSARKMKRKGGDKILNSRRLSTHSHTDAPDFLNLDGSDDRVRELRERVRNWLNTWHLGENWCAETLINVMARQKEILEGAHLRSIPQPYTDHWEIAWAKRFYTFIDDVQKRLAECGIKGCHFRSQLSTSVEGRMDGERH